ncbi:MAG: acetyltransferase, family, partial [Sphingomonas bacterium]|nr:acetyltransferase, family [Sphingomonas bacterium]
MIDICEDDLSGEATRALLALHLAAMRENSPPGSVFALDLSGLRAPGVTVWTAWRGSAVAGIVALKTLRDGGGEIKSMRTHPDDLRQGVGAALLRHVIAQAHAQGLK